MRKRKLPSWISNPVELVQAQFESLAIGPRSSLQIAEELVDLLGTLDPLLSVDVEVCRLLRYVSSVIVLLN